MRVMSVGDLPDPSVSVSLTCKNLFAAQKKGKRIDRLTNGISWYQRNAKYRYSDSMLYRERDGNALMLHTL